VELRHLEHFLAVAESSGFTRAAARLHMVQSTLSVSVRALEAELGARLFDRTTRTVVLTDAGRALLPEARRTLAAAEAARESVDAVVGGTRGTVRIGIMHAMSALDLAGLLSRFRAERPLVHIRPQTHPHGSAGLVAGITDGILDVAFAAPGRALPGLTVVDVVTEPIQLACSADDPLAGRQRVALTELAHRRFIDVPVGWGSRDSVDRLLASHQIERAVDVEVADVATVLQLVRAGLGIALVAPSSAPEADRDDLLAVQPAPLFTISMVTAKERPLSAAASAFVQLAQRHLLVAPPPATPRSGCRNP